MKKRKTAERLKRVTGEREAPAALRNKVSDLQKEVDRLTEALKDSRKTKFKIPVQGKTKTSKGAFVRLFIPDTHGCHVDAKSLSALLADIEYLNPKEIIHVGDVLDAGGFLAQHQTLGYVAETSYTFEDDVVAANTLWDEVQKRAPNAALTQIEGNHDARIEKWCITQSLRNNKDSKYLLSLFGPQAVLNTEKRGIRYVGRGKFHDNLRVPGTIKAGKCYVTHGTKHGADAAKKMLVRFQAPVVFGHVHKFLQSSVRTVHAGEMCSWSIGYLAREQPYWKHGDPTDWVQGYAFQIVQQDGGFLHINVPIIDNKSYLSHLGELLT